MATGIALTGICPKCGAGGQGFVVLRSLFRRWVAQCTQCGAKLESDIGLGAYLLLCLYSQLILWLVILPLLFGLLTRAWLIAGAACAAFLLFVIPPAMVLHGRKLSVQDE